MIELIVILVVTVMTLSALSLIGRRVEQVLGKIELLLAYLAAAIIFLLMLYVLMEVLMRYAFNSPLPGHLEGAELLLPMIVFFAISYTQAKKGHVGMSLVVEVLPPRMQRVTNTFTLGLSVLTCAVLAYFGAKQAYFSYEINDVTMTPPYWPIWPSASIVPVGYGLLALRMSLQILQHIAPRRFPGASLKDLEQPSTF